MKRTERLIELRRESKFNDQFVKEGTIGIVKKKIWKEIGDEVGIHLKLEQIGKKYANLLSRYRKYREKCNTRDNGKITYLYSEVFNKSLGAGAVNDPVGKFEIGGEFPSVRTQRPINERVEFAAGGNSKNNVKRSNVNKILRMST